MNPKATKILTWSFSALLLASLFAHSALAGDEKPLSESEFLDEVELPFSGLDYDPIDAEGLDDIQDSDMALHEGELKILKEKGIVLSESKTFPTFTAGYETLYHQDLPVFISADSLLFALHRSYDSILIRVEQDFLVTELEALLVGLRERLAAGEVAGFEKEVERDVDVYLAVALSLLRGTLEEPLRGGSPELIAELVAVAMDETSWTGELWGKKREVDGSQFKPRGHYTRHPTLMPYFRSMMWLGRVDFRIVADPEKPESLDLRQLGDALALTALMDKEAIERWQKIDKTIEVFVGVSDNMTPLDALSLQEALGVEDLAKALSQEPEVLVKAIVDAGFAEQKILSHVVETVGVQETAIPLSFRLLGQRYIVDSQVFSELVYNRMILPGGDDDQRFMPSPLDVGYAVLKNSYAAMMLKGELAQYPYAAHLKAKRVMVDGMEQAFWSSSLYNLWLSAIRTLSPTREEVQSPKDHGLPTLAATEAWSQRLLNAQLASWAELRHDTLLYAKQSYSARIVCEFPDFYVDPYPEFFQALEAYATLGLDQLESIELSDDKVKEYFENLLKVSSALREMAELQRKGEPYEDKHLDFVNEMLKEERSAGCGTIEVETPGWYRKLFFNQWESLEYLPTIADVHTDANGPQVLHVGTKSPRLMVLAIETCDGPRAYAGLSSSYYEVKVQGFNRLTDDEWAYLGDRDDVQINTPPWIAPLIAPRE